MRKNDIRELRGKIHFRNDYDYKTLRKTEPKKREKLVDKLKEGYLSTCSEDRALHRDWESTLGDGID